MKTMRPNDDEKLFSASDVIVIPGDTVTYTLINKGGGEMLFLIGKDQKPITFTSDTSFVIQSFGVKYTWIRATRMPSERVDELRSIIAADHQLNIEEQQRQYILPTTERQLRTTNHRLYYIIVIMLLAIVLVIYIALNIHGRNQRIARQLKQIQEEQDKRPQPIRKAMKEVEKNFFESDYYHTMRHRLSSGERLQQTDWEEIDKQLNTVYSGFSHHLFNLYNLSSLEYQVCLLIKMRTTPSEMAAVLSKDVSTISSIRSRLYQKVFQQKGSSKDWDNFVLSL